MNIKLHTLAVLLSVALLSQLSLAGPKGDRPDGPPSGERPQFGRRGESGGPGRGFRPPPHPLMTVLDANDDGQLSRDEIAAAAKALAALDKDGDGALSHHELRPEFGSRGGFGGDARGPGGQGGPEGRRGPDGLGGEPGEFGPRKGRRGERGGRQGFGEGGEFGQGQRNKGEGRGRRGPGGPGFLEHIKQLDINGDDVLTEDELPPARAERMLERLDSNEDGKIDMDELQTMVDRFQERGGPRGPGGPQGGRPPRKPRPDFEK